MEPLLVMRNIHKSFGATYALRGVDLEVYPGQVHIVAGENGAGKSTLMKILTGVHKPDQGEILYQGNPLHVGHPKEALLQGIAMIYQEFNLALHLPVHANVFLGHECKQNGCLDFKTQRKRTLEIFQRFDMEIDPDSPVQNLGVSQRQMVEIARALSVNAKLIVMDEPTAALSQNEIDKLFEIILSLQKDNVGIIYISHYLEEFDQVGDVVTVLRDGERVACEEMQYATPEGIIQKMVGRSVEDLYPSHKRQYGDVLFSVQDLNSPNGTSQVDLEVRAGEIVGIAGLVGAGRTEMLRAMFGLDPSHVKDLQVHGFTILPPNPRTLSQNHVGYLSEDRAGEGLAQSLTIGMNLTMPVLRRFRANGIFSVKKQNEHAAKIMQEMGIKAISPSQTVNQLSGGNQQKVALARLLAADAHVLLLDEPTRGIDVGSKAEIYRIINRLAEEGKSVLMVSSYLPELFGMCDSICAMYKGRLSRKYPVHQVDADKIMALATGFETDDHLQMN